MNHGKPWGRATFTKEVHFFYTNKLGRLYAKNLNKTQMIRHRILGDLLGAGLVC